MKASGCDIPDWMLKIKKPSRYAASDVNLYIHLFQKTLSRSKQQASSEDRNECCHFSFTNRNVKKQLQKAPIKRPAIKTVTKYDLSKAKRKRCATTETNVGGK